MPVWLGRGPHRTPSDEATTLCRWWGLELSTNWTHPRGFLCLLVLLPLEDVMSRCMICAVGSRPQVGVHRDRLGGDTMAIRGGDENGFSSPLLFSSSISSTRNSGRFWPFLIKADLVACQHRGGQRERRRQRVQVRVHVRLPSQRNGHRNGQRNGLRHGQENGRESSGALARAPRPPRRTPSACPGSPLIRPHPPR